MSTPSSAARPPLGPLLWRVVALWLIPFVAVSPLVGADGVPRVAPLLLKGVAVGALVATTLWVRRRPPAGWSAASVAAWGVAVSIGLDLVVLIGTLGLPVGTWAATVLPAYGLIPLLLLARRPTAEPG